jgi:anti-sigma regulatory factor (Ser/Thr protein kinase)
MPVVKRSFPAEATSLREVRDFIRQRAKEVALFNRDADDLILAVSEVCANAVQHAESGNFIVSWTGGLRQPTEVKVRDDGVFGSRGLGYYSTSRGIGLPLTAALVDELSIARGTAAHPGTEVRIVKYRDN